MVKRSDILELGRLVDGAKTILLLQPDKPDGDSLASMLALEEIFGDLGKTTHMYTGGRVEDYLNHLPGWDRVSNDWPDHYDLAILVDTAAPNQVARMLGAHHPALRKHPWVVIDHHGGERTDMDGTTMELLDAKAAATSEIIYRIAKTLGWLLNERACQRLVASLFADTLNLTTPSVTTRTIEIFAALVKLGKVDVSALHRAYREATATDPDLLAVKGQLLQGVEFFADGKIALVVVPQDVVKAYRQRTSLSALVMFEMLWARGVKVAAVMSDYGTIIRTSLRARAPIAAKVAAELGGGGHPMAAAFGDDTTPLLQLKAKLIAALTEALAELD
jgi:phosphoesterase RecJ-like protein